MILKYKVPKEERFRFDNKKVLYCKVCQIQEIKSYSSPVYAILRVKMINFHNMSNIFTNDDLKKLNLLDYIKIKFKIY